MAVASILQMINIVRGMIGDKCSYHQEWYSNEELIDKLEIAVLRHKSNLFLSNLPKSEIMPVCYRCAIDLCLELAARNAPFSLITIEGMTVDKSGVMNNWLQLSSVYKEQYLVEISGGLGSEDQINQGDLTRQSYTTGRQVPFYQTKAFDAPILELVTLVDTTVTLSWSPIRDVDFYVYVVQKKVTGEDWEDMTTYYNQLDTSYVEDVDTPGYYQYRVLVRRGLQVNRTSNFPFNPSAFQYLDTYSNVVSVNI